MRFNGYELSGQTVCFQNFHHILSMVTKPQKKILRIFKLKPDSAMVTSTFTKSAKKYYRSCPLISKKGGISGQKSRTPTSRFLCNPLSKSSFLLSLLTPPLSKPETCCVSPRRSAHSQFNQLQPGRIYCGQGPSVTLCGGPTWSHASLLRFLCEIHKEIKRLPNTDFSVEFGLGPPKRFSNHARTPTLRLVSKM